MNNIKAHDSKQVVTVTFLKPSDFEKIVTDAMASKQFIDELSGAT